MYQQRKYKNKFMVEPLIKKALNVTSEKSEFYVYTPILNKLMQFKVIISIVAIIFIAISLGEIIPVELKTLFYTISNFMRKFLMFFLPFLVFPFLVSSIASIRYSSAYLVSGILVAIIISNFTSIMIAYGVGTKVIPFLGLQQVKHFDSVKELLPIFDINLNPVIEIEATMILAFVLGLLLSYYDNPKIIKFFKQYTNLSTSFFEKIFVPIIPLYVLGNILKATHESDLSTLLPSFGSMIIMIVLTQCTYITFMFFIGSKQNISKTIESINNVIPAGIVAFSTMSSVVTMPVTLKAAEKNIDNTNIARIAISTTVNSHDVGECISLPMIALTIFYLTFLSFPDLPTYATFAFFVTIAQFSGVGIPGGSIVIILPFLSKYLNFDSEMCSLIITLSILMDPVGTCNNVMGNSAFAMIINRIYLRASKLFNINK